MATPGRIAVADAVVLGAVVLGAIAALAAAALVATPWLIKPYPASAPWYDSAATFPRFALVLVLAGACGEWLMRRRGVQKVESEELDAGQSRPAAMALALVLFLVYSWITPLVGFLAATAAFLLATARSLGLAWRTAFALTVPLSLVLSLVFEKALKVAFGGPSIWGW